MLGYAEIFPKNLREVILKGEREKALSGFGLSRNVF